MLVHAGRAARVEERTLVLRIDLVVVIEAVSVPHVTYVARSQVDVVVVVVSCVIGILSSFKLERKAFYLVHVVLFDVSVAHALQNPAARLIGLAYARKSPLRLCNAHSRLNADFVPLAYASELPRGRFSSWGRATLWSCVSFDWDFRLLATGLHFATDLIGGVVPCEIRQISFCILHFRS